MSPDLSRPLAESPLNGHNRWHPEIPPVVHAEPGQIIELLTRDGLDGQITARTRPQDLESLDFSRAHPLTGPVAVVGAEPDDLLVVEILDVETAGFGFTTVRPGSGLLGDEFEDSLVVRWTIEDGVARSHDLPGVAIRGCPFVGVMGVAPAPERLRLFADREAALARRGGRVSLPSPVGAVPAGGPPAQEGLRTVPPRENGGNLDVKYLRKGARLTLTVEVPNAHFSLGDVHFAQGNGECCSQAIEVEGRVLVRFSLVEGRHVSWRPRYPTIQVAPSRGGRNAGFLVTTGVPIDELGNNEDMDLRLAARAALREMIGYLTLVRGYTRPQAYVICSVAVDLEISEAVNVPNGVVAAVLPLEIFE